MKIKGLCTTCVELETCIFGKEPPVWQCEEFSNGSHVAASRKQPRAEKALLCEETTAE